MIIIRYLARNHPILFALGSTAIWLVLLIGLTGIASGALGIPFIDDTNAAVGRLAVCLCFLYILWKLGWLKSSGVARLGRWQVWLIALGGMIYFAAASLRSFFGTLTFDFPGLNHLPDTLATVMTNFAIILCEEIPFRGFILHALARAWGNTRRGLIGSVLLSSLLFALLHITQVFAYDVSLSSVSLLVVETLIVSIWWGALVISGNSIWPGGMVHFMFNTIMALQALSTPVLDAGTHAYMSILLLSLPLGVLGIVMLLCAPLHPLGPQIPQTTTLATVQMKNPKVPEDF